MEAMSGSPDVDTNFFDTVARVLQGDTLAVYTFIVCLDQILWMPIEAKSPTQLGECC